MKFNPDIHHRRSIRLKGYDYAQQGLYFVTLCVKNRMCLLGKIVEGEMRLSEWGEIVENIWFEIPKHFPAVVLHKFVVMPNHFHGIFEITDANNVTDVGANNIRPNEHGNTVLANNIRQNAEKGECYSPLRTPHNIGTNNDAPKMRPCGTSRTVGSIVRGFKTGITQKIGFSLWQRDMWEHIIRDFNDYQRIYEYIVNNPAKWKNDRFYTVQ